MESVVLTRPIRIVVIMTPGFRERFIEEARAQVAQIDENLERLVPSAAVEGEGPQAEFARQQIEAERGRLMRRRGEIEWRVKEVEAVPDGAHLPYRTYEGPVEVREGDDFRERMAEAEVVLKDWKVVEIRLAGAAQPS